MNPAEPARPVQCRRCGATLVATDVTCPRCALGLAARTPTPAPDTLHVHTHSARPRPAPPSLADIAASFPEFEGFEFIGQGGMGVVYKARHRQLERVVALKVLPRETADEPGFRERFLREARALARLAHPNIVAVHDFGEKSGLYFLVLEFVDGFNLRQAMQERLLAPKEALRIVRELCTALEYAHDEGIVHRDIKPENVLVDRAGHVKIADFGLAKLVGLDAGAELTGTGQVMGTPHYMAPEQIEHPEDVDHRADLFALGVVFYEMLTGSLPRGVFELPSRRIEVDVRCDEIVLKALEREPSRRYQHAAQVRTDIEQVQTGPAAVPLRAPESRAQPTLDPFRGPRAFLFFTALWVLVAVVWNLGPFVFGFTLVACSSLSFVVYGRVRASPDLNQALNTLSGPEKTARGLIAFAWFILGTLAIGLAHIGWWERGTTHWTAAHRGAQGLFEAWRANPWALLRLTGVEAGAGLPPAVLLQRSYITQNPSELVELYPAIPFVIGMLLLYAALACVAVVRKPDLLRRESEEIARRVMYTVLGSLLFVWLVPFAVQFPGGIKAVSVERRFTTTRPLAEARGKVYGAMLRLSLAVDVDQALRVVGGPLGTDFTEAQIYRGASSSPFKRWKLGLRGPERATPQIWATLIPRADGGGTEVLLEAGSTILDSLAYIEWNARLATIESDLR